IVALLMMRIAKTKGKPSDESPLRSVIQGFQFAMGDLPMRSALLLLSTLSLFGLQYSVFMPIYANEILKGGKRMLGLLLSFGGVGDDVHGCAADRGVACGRRGEAHRGAVRADGVWISGAPGQLDFHRSSGDEVGRNTDGASGLGWIRPVEPGRPSERLGGGRGSDTNGSKIHGCEDGVDFGAQRRERADWIGGRGISREEQGLAAAAAEILFPAVTGLAGLLHPIFSAEFLECGGALPNITQTALFHVLKR